MYTIELRIRPAYWSLPDADVTAGGNHSLMCPNRLLGISDARYSYDYRYIAYAADNILFLDDMFLLQFQNPFIVQYPVSSNIPRSAK